MTTIIVDRRSMCMAGDTQIDLCDVPYHGKKVFRLPHQDGEMLIGFTGNLYIIDEVLKWFRDGKNPNDKPKEDCGGQFFVLHSDGQIEIFSKTWQSFFIDCDYTAIGGGRDFAIAALYLGKSPKESIEIASALDIHTGGPVQIEYLGNHEHPQHLWGATDLASGARGDSGAGVS